MTRVKNLNLRSTQKTDKKNKKMRKTKRKMTRARTKKRRKKKQRKARTKFRETSQGRKSCRSPTSRRRELQRTSASEPNKLCPVFCVVSSINFNSKVEQAF